MLLLAEGPGQGRPRYLRPFEIGSQLDGGARFENVRRASFPNLVIKEHLKLEPFGRRFDRPDPGLIAKLGERLALGPAQAAALAADKQSVIGAKFEMDGGNNTPDKPAGASGAFSVPGGNPAIAPNRPHPHLLALAPNTVKSESGIVHATLPYAARGERSNDSPVTIGLRTDDDGAATATR